MNSSRCGRLWKLIAARIFLEPWLVDAVFTAENHAWADCANFRQKRGETLRQDAERDDKYEAERIQGAFSVPDIKSKSVPSESAYVYLSVVSVCEKISNYYCYFIIILVIWLGYDLIVYFIIWLILLS